MPRDRLTALDRSFLQLETDCAHMHVAGRLRFLPGAAGGTITLDRVRALVGSRLHLSKRFRQRLAFTPGGLSAPVWVENGSAGLILKAHHAMVDGLSALALGLLLLDVRPDADAGDEPPPEWRPDPAPGTVRLTVDALADYGVESLRAARGAVKAVG